MTLRDWNSFQYHATGWSGQTTRDAGVGQNGYPGFNLTTAQGVIYSHVPMAHVLHGFCYKPGGVAATQRVAWYTDGAGSSPDCELQQGAAGELIAYRANGTVELGRTAPVLAVGVETYIEVRLKASLTVGELEVRVNGDPTPVLDLSGINVGLASIVDLRWNGYPGGIDYSAWYFIEVDATAPNDFLGHIRFAPLDPTGNGTSSELTGSDGNQVDNYLLVDDGATSTNHDSDTTYVQSPAVGDQDTYAMENLPTTPLSIIAVCPLIIARKTDAGSRAITPVVRSGGVDYDGPDEKFLSTSYTVLKAAFLVNPNTAAAWAEAGVNAHEAGLRVTT